MFAYDKDRTEEMMSGQLAAADKRLQEAAIAYAESGKPEDRAKYNQEKAVLTVLEHMLKSLKMNCKIKVADNA